MEGQIRFRKIFLKDLIDSLVELYHEGADFVDIVGKQGPIQDSIGIAVMSDYMAPAEEMEDPQENKKLTEDDINACLE
jgi:hypothetical protein